MPRSAAAAPVINLGTLHWTAGFLQGKGSFGNDPYSGRGKPCPKLRVRSKDRAPLDRLRALYGGTVAWERNTYAYRLVGKKVIGLALTIWTLVSDARRQEIETMVERWRAPESIGVWR